MLFVSNLLTRKTLPAELHMAMLAKFNERHSRQPAADTGSATDTADGAKGGADRIDDEGDGGGEGGGDGEDQREDSAVLAAKVDSGERGSAVDDDGAGAGGSGGSDGSGDGKGGGEGGDGLNDVRSKLLAERRKLLDAKAARAEASGSVIDGAAGEGEGEGEGDAQVVDLAAGAMIAEGSVEWTAAVAGHAGDGDGLGEGPLKLTRARNSFNALDEVVETVEGIDEYPVVADALGYTHELISGILQYHPLLREDEDTLVATMMAVDRVVFGELGSCHELFTIGLTTTLAISLSIVLSIVLSIALSIAPSPTIPQLGSNLPSAHPLTYKL